MVATVAWKLAPMLPAGTVTLDGTDTLALLLDRVARTPPAGAIPLNSRSQLVDPGALRVVGEQVRLLSVPPDEVVSGKGVRVTVIVPEPPDVRIGFPPASEALVPVSVIGTLPAVAPAAMARFTVATNPLAIGVVFNPYTTQTVEPLLMEQTTLLLAVAEFTETLVTMVAG